MDAGDAEKIAHPVEIPLTLVHGIRLSSWMPLPLFEATRKLLAGIPGCAAIPISRSELIENERWKQNVESFRR